jgi:hypothetical protein
MFFLKINVLPPFLNIKAPMLRKTKFCVKTVKARAGMCLGGGTCAEQMHPATRKTKQNKIKE